MIGRLALVITLAVSPRQQRASDEGASPSSVRDTAVEVTELVEAGRLDEALSVIERASENDPDPRYLFMRAALEEQLGRCGAAVPLYRQFLDAAVEPDDRGEAERGLARCGAEPAPEPVTERPSAPVALPPPASATTPPATHRAATHRPATHRPRPEPVPKWYRDPAGMLLAFGGLATTSVGTGFWARAAVLAARAGTEDRRTEFDRTVDRAARFERVGIGAVAIGSVFVLSGVVRLAIFAARAKKTRGRKKD